MKSTISFATFLAGATCVLAMTACDSVKDVPEKPLTLPAVTVVLEGTVSNMSSLRSITLVNNGDEETARSFIAAAPTVVNGGPVTMPFSFGSIAAGTAYDITVKTPPFGKTCVVANGTGTLTAGVATNIAITCTNAAPRYNLTVSLPTTSSLFTGLTGAKVRVTNEEEIIEKPVAAGDTTVTFPGVLIDARTQLSAATWTVTASTSEGNSVSKCAVANPTGQNNFANLGPPTTTAPAVGNPLAATSPACKFAVGGSVGYSLPAGVAFAGTTIDGLSLQLRDPAGTVLETKTINCTPGNATVTTGAPTVSATSTALIAGAILSFPVPSNPGAGCTYKFDTLVTSSVSKGLYEVVVSQQPSSGTTPLRCVATNGGSANVYTVGTTSPVEVTRTHVLCRAVPAPEKRLKGIYRLQSSTWTPDITATPTAPVTVTYDPFNFTVSNTATSSFLSLFDDGTFLYGSHGYATNTAATQGNVGAPTSGPGGTAGTIVGSVPVGGVLATSGSQVEHGFYDYDATAQTLRFTLVTDTNNSAGFPATFSPLYSGSQARTSNKNPSNTQTTTGGLSATPNPQHRDNSSSLYMATMTMNGVTFGTRQVLQETVNGASVFQTVRTMSGEFGGAAGGAAWQTVGNCRQTPSPPAATTANGPCLSSGGTYVFSTTNCSNSSPCVVQANGNRLKWELQEPPSINGEMTGAWMSEDHRRFWVWDHRTIYGFGAAVVGGHPSMNDACFTMENLRQSSGFYVRRGSGPGCHPFSQPASQPPPAQVYTHTQGSDSTDYPATILAQGLPALLPGFIGRIPGGQVFPGNTTASPVQFHVAPVATFAASANPTYFPNLAGVSFDWCTPSRPGDTAEVLGMRDTSNNEPINAPIYMCRTKVAPP